MTKALMACALLLGVAACTPEDVAKTCRVGKLAYEAVKIGRGGEAERQAAEDLRAWCASKGHVYN